MLANLIGIIIMDRVFTRLAVYSWIGFKSARMENGFYVLKNIKVMAKVELIATATFGLEAEVESPATWERLSRPAGTCLRSEMNKFIALSHMAGR